MQQLLPQHRILEANNHHVIPAGNKDLEMKQKLLQENKELRELYLGLVNANVISAEEFWTNYAPKSCLGNVPVDCEQKAGVSAGFLSDVATMDGCNGLKLTLTKDVINAIFTAYPAVKQKHVDKVPHELTEQEFWTKFFQSHYFHRDRVKNLSPGELFADCVKFEDDDMQNAKDKGTHSKRYDLNYTQDSYVLTDLVRSVSPSRTGETNKGALLRRFNYHSSRVLQSSLGNDATNSSSTIGSTMPQTSNHSNAHAQRVHEMSEDADCPELEAISTFALESQSSSSAIELPLNKGNKNSDIKRKVDPKIVDKYGKRLKSVTNKL